MEPVIVLISLQRDCGGEMQSVKAMAHQSGAYNIILKSGSNCNEGGTAVLIDRP